MISTSRAIRSARVNDFVHNEGLANEMAARFYTQRGFERIANTYLRDARNCYLRWGADGKVRQLEQLYPHLRADKPTSDPTTTIHGAGRAPRSGYRDQGLGSVVRRDRAGEADRHAHAHGNRARRRRTRSADSSARRGLSDRSRGHNEQQRGESLSATGARHRCRSAGIGVPLCPPDEGKRSAARCFRPERIFGR